MEQFLSKHANAVIGTLSGFDLLVFRGTLRQLSYRTGMAAYLWAKQVLLKDFASPDPTVEGGVGGSRAAGPASDPLFGFGSHQQGADRPRHRQGGRRHTGTGLHSHRGRTVPVV